MATLLFNDRGWEVATSAWSAASKSPKELVICYQWGADGISWFDSATGNARITLNINVTDFMRRLARGDQVIDLR